MRTKTYKKGLFLTNENQNLAMFHLKDGNKTIIQNYERIDKLINTPNTLRVIKLECWRVPGTDWKGCYRNHYCWAVTIITIFVSIKSILDNFSWYTTLLVKKNKMSTVGVYELSGQPSFILALKSSFMVQSEYEKNEIHSTFALFTNSHDDYTLYFQLKTYRSRICSLFIINLLNILLKPHRISLVSLTFMCMSNYIKLTLFTSGLHRGFPMRRQLDFANQRSFVHKPITEV